MFIKQNRLSGCCPGCSGLSGFMDYLDAFGDQVAGYYDQVASAASSAVSWAGDKARAEVAAFRAKLQQYISAYNSLAANPPPYVVSQERWDEYNKLLSDSKSLADRAQWVESQIQAVESATGVSLSGYNLGILPAIVIGPALVAAIIGITYLLSQGIQAISDYQQRSSYASAVQAQGGDVASALATYDKNMEANRPKGLFGDASQLVWPVAIVLGAMLLLKEKRS